MLDMSGVILRLKNYYRFFTIEVLKIEHLETVKDLLQPVLDSLTIRSENEERKLYMIKDDIFYIPSSYLILTLQTLKSLYMDRGNYELIELSKFDGKYANIIANKEYKLRDIQQEYHDIIVNDKNDRIFIDLRTGSGKASWCKEKILTLKGFKNMDELLPFDVVINAHGRPVTIQGIYPQGVKQLYEITTLDGRKHRCCLEHLWEVKIGNAFRVVDTEFLLKNYKKKNIKLPYLLNHTLSKDDLINKYGEKEAETILNNLTNNTLAYLEDNKPIDYRIEFSLLDASLRLFLISGVIKRFCINKTTIGRDTYFTIKMDSNLLHHKEEFINLFHSVGCTFVTKHIDMVGEVLIIQSKYKSLDGFISNIANRLLKEKNKIGYTKIVSIKKFIKDEAICIKINDPEELYVTNNFLITHNTVIATACIATLKQKVGVVVLPRYLDKWKEDFLKYTEVNEDKIYTIRGYESIEKLLDNNNGEDYDVFLFSIRTLFNLIKDAEAYPERICITKLFNTLGIGVLLSDESHQELTALFNILTFSNVPKVIGMSATFISDRPEEKRLQELLFPKDKRISNLTKFENHIEYVDASYFINMNGLKFKYQTHLGYSQIDFEKSILKYRKLAISYFNMLYEILKADYLKRRKEGEKVLFYFGLVAMCSSFIEFILNKEEIQSGKIKVKKYTQEDAYDTILTADIIVSTKGSSSTALDIPGLIAVCDTHVMRSNKNNLQSIGRLRKQKDARTIYYSIYAKNIKAQKSICRLRLKQCEPVIKSVKFYSYGEVGIN